MVRTYQTILISVLAASLAGSLAAQSAFLRGDIDGDGSLTLADAVRALKAVLSRSELPCADAADFTDNGLVQLGDAGLMIEYVLKGGPPPPPPFAAAGTDPTADGISCEETPSGLPVEDPTSRYTLSVLPALGGQPGFRLRVSLDNSIPVLGGSLVVGLPGSWDKEAKVLEARPGLELAAKLEQDGLVAGHVGDDGKLRCAWLLSRSELGSALAPGASRPLLDLMICPGTTPAGEYRLELASGADLVTEDGGRLVIEGSGANLTLEAEGTKCPDVKETAASVRAYHYLSDASAEVGGVFRVSLFSTCNTEALTVGYLIRWDPEVVKVIGGEKTRAGSFLWGYLVNKDGGDAGSEIWHIAIPFADIPVEHFQGVRICDPCGYRSGGETIVPSAVLLMTNYLVTIEPRRPFPVDAEMHPLDLIFEVLPTARPGETWIEFFENPGTNRADNYIDPYVPTGDPLVRFQALPLFPAHVTILPASGSKGFLRGDANLDGALGISDAIFLLLNLFGGPSFEVACRDAADSNDDGRLDVSDPIHLLAFLFLGGAAPPQPYPEPGADPTEDSLGCGAE
jgi:hypothetical protein